MDHPPAHLELDHDVTAPRVARRFVSSVLADWGLGDGILERSQLLVSELVSNAVLHGTAPVRMSISDHSDDDGAIRVEVSNAGDGRPVMRRAQRSELSGRGLQLIDELAAGWGTRLVDGRTTVWFNISTRDR
jgi:anti-sigma regulatory factor (Ser/Thr protein kinase)